MNKKKAPWKRYNHTPRVSLSRLDREGLGTARGARIRARRAHRTIVRDSFPAPIPSPSLAERAAALLPPTPVLLVGALASLSFLGYVAAS